MCHLGLFSVPHTHKGSSESTSSLTKLPARKEGWTADFTLISVDLNWAIFIFLFLIWRTILGQRQASQMDPYNNCSHWSWGFLFFKTGMWKLEGYVKPQFFLLGVSIRNAAPAKKKGPRVPVGSCHRHSYSSHSSLVLWEATRSILAPVIAP